MARNLDAFIDAMDALLGEGSSVVTGVRDKVGWRQVMIDLADRNSNPALALDSEQVEALADGALEATEALRIHLDAAITAMTP